MDEIFRIFEVRSDKLTEIAFVRGKQSTQFYLSSCNSHNTTSDVFYFAEKIKVQQ